MWSCLKWNHNPQYAWSLKILIHSTPCPRQNPKETLISQIQQLQDFNFLIPHNLRLFHTVPITMALSRVHITTNPHKKVSEQTIGSGKSGNTSKDRRVTWKTARATNCSSLRVSWCQSLFWYRSASELYQSESSGCELRSDSKYCRAAIAERFLIHTNTQYHWCAFFLLFFIP